MARGYETDPKAMSFLDHLRDLRRMLIHVVLAILVAAVAAWAFSGRLLDLLLDALALENVQFLSPMEPFNARLRVALVVGLTASLPFVSFRIWSFVVPALRESERRVILPSAIATTLLFVIGAAFSIYVLTPMMLGLLMGFGTEHARADLALGPVLAFVFRMTIACAVLFQLPLVLALTTRLGATTPRMLITWWRHAVVLIFILAAIITPGDGPSQVILAVPLVVLYFLSVLVSWIIYRGRKDGGISVRSGAGPGAGPGGGPGGGPSGGSSSSTGAGPDTGDAAPPAPLPAPSPAPRKPPEGTEPRAGGSPGEPGGGTDETKGDPA